jgi:mannose-6-phosphate isomerase-like protein (cupin superfamily)
MPYVAQSEALNALSLDLTAIRAERGPAPWRVPLVGTHDVRCVLLAFPPGYSTVPHHHPHAVETFFIVDGTGTFAIDARPYPAAPGTLLWSPAGVQHTITADGPTDLVFIASVAPNQDRPDETVEAPVPG